MEKMLEIRDLYTSPVDDPKKEILKGLNLEINKGEIHVIMGPNGSGKSTLAKTCFKSYKYNINKGNIYFDGKDITNETTDKISKSGLFMSFQNPEDIPGVTVANLIKTSLKSITGERISMAKFYSDINSNMDKLNMDHSYALRELGSGFSGGEKKKIEMLQLFMLNPKLAILDETDSGLDVDAIRVVSNGIKMFKNESNSVLIITHSTKILDGLNVDKVHILVNGKIVESGDSSLIKKIDEKGYKEYLDEEN